MSYVTSKLSHLHFHTLNIISMRISLLICRCQCGNCDLQFLQNISECYCCCELEGCVEALTGDLVLQDLPEDAKLTCITQHPGFNPVCLQKWSLRLASHKYRTKGKKRYSQTGSEERWAVFLRIHVLTSCISVITCNTKLALEFRTFRHRQAKYFFWAIRSLWRILEGEFTLHTVYTAFTLV